jgi:hypothetical protein
MPILSTVVSLGRRLYPIDSQKIRSVPPKHYCSILNIMLLVFICISALTASVVAAARLGAVPLHVDQPEGYLASVIPPLPKDVKKQCSPLDYRYVSCFVYIFGQEVSLRYEPGSRTILRISIKVRDYTAGDLIAVWGTPTGIIQVGDYINIFWGKRLAVVFSPTFQVSSRVDYIGYQLEQQPTEPWRGFISSKSDR